MGGHECVVLEAMVSFSETGDAANGGGGGTPVRNGSWRTWKAGVERGLPAGLSLTNYQAVLEKARSLVRKFDFSGRPGWKRREPCDSL